MRLVFAGTPPFAAAALQALATAGHTVQAVLTQPDRPAGRGLKLQPSAVKQLAQAAGWPVLQPRSLRLDGRWPDDAQAARAALQALQPQVMVVAAYGLILPTWTLALPTEGCLNIHGSLLPRWRGAAPIQRAIEAGDATTGITIMQMDEGLDTGDMRRIAELAIAADETSATLHDRLAALGAQEIVAALAELDAGRLPRQAQPREGVTYAHKIDKGEAAIDWALPAGVIERRIRAFDPFPGAVTGWNEVALKVWRARSVADASGAAPGTLLAISPQGVRVACGTDSLDLLSVQLPGGRRQDIATFCQTPAGRALLPGQRLNAPPAG